MNVSSPCVKICELVRISHQKTGGTGDPPVPSGDSPIGTEGMRKQTANFEREKALPIPSGQWPDGTGESPVLPKLGEKCGLDSHGICLGCLRSLDEIARWSRMTEHEKSQVIAALDERRKFFPTINQRKTE